MLQEGVNGRSNGQNGRTGMTANRVDVAHAVSRSLSAVDAAKPCGPGQTGERVREGAIWKPNYWTEAVSRGWDWQELAGLAGEESRVFCHVGQHCMRG